MQKLLKLKKLAWLKKPVVPKKKESLKKLVRPKKPDVPKKKELTVPQLRSLMKWLQPSVKLLLKAKKLSQLLVKPTKL
ncbi:MAG: hypothetical protein KBS83_08500 [Lachnospiraceae bacterium]|nr:hypothetical protein [Candidatus Equihabitans merdae]